MTGRRCSTCQGSGEMNNAKCSPCKGEGRVDDKLNAVKVGPLTIEHGPTYWRITGRIPLELARRIYLDFDHGKEMRADGDADGAEPVWPRVKFYSRTTGRPVLPTKEKEECEKHAQSDSILMRRVAAKIVRENDFAENHTDETVYEGFVELYHVDSDAALERFLALCLNYGLFDRTR